MRTRIFAFAAIFCISILTAPAVFAKSGQFVVQNKVSAGTSLPLQRGRAVAVGVNRNYNDTMDFGDELYGQVPRFASSSKLLQQEFIKREEVSDCDYVLTFEVKKWKEKNHDYLPENVKVVIYIYDSSFNLLVTSKVSFKKQRKMEYSNYLEPLIEKYLLSVFENQTESSK